MSAQGRSSYGDVFNDEVNDEEPKFPSSTFPGGAVSLNETFSLLHILTDKQPEPDMLAMTREKSWRVIWIVHLIQAIFFQSQLKRQCL
jgi:hypothetical protein